MLEHVTGNPQNGPLFFAAVKRGGETGRDNVGTPLYLEKRVSFAIPLPRTKV